MAGPKVVFSGVRNAVLVYGNPRKISNEKKKKGKMVLSEGKREEDGLRSPQGLAGSLQIESN